MSLGPYSHDLLARAAAIGRIGRLRAPHGTAQAVSRVCGSEVTVDVTLDETGAVADYAQEVRACVVGQSAAAVVAEAALGATLKDVEGAREDFRRFLDADPNEPPALGDYPALRDGPFRGLLDLVAVRPYRQRHASAQLALKALGEAIAAAGAR